MTASILVVTSTFPRWQGDNVSPFVLQLCEALVDLGWQVTVLAPHAPGAAPQETWGMLHIHRFRYCWPASCETVCYGGGALVNLREDPLGWLKVPLLVIAEAIAVFRLVLLQRPSLVHAHWLLPQGLVSALLGRILRTPVVVTVHGADIFGLRGMIWRPLKALALAAATLVTANSSATAQMARGILDRHLEIIPMGAADKRSRGVVDTTAAIRERYGGMNRHMVIFVGRLIEEKGPLDLLEAVRLLRERIPGIACVFVGDGPVRSRLETRIAALGMEGIAFLAGWQSPDNIGAMLAAADVFVGPSKQAANGWVEAQGIVFAEAMLAGVPVIATASGGIPDTVIHEVTGLLVPEASPGAIADAILRLHDDRELAVALVSRALANAEQELTMSRTAQRFSALFKRTTSVDAA